MSQSAKTDAGAEKAEEVVEYARQSASCHQVSDAEPQPEMEQPNRAETNSEPHAATEFVTDAEILSDYIRETESETAQVEYETQNTRKRPCGNLESLLCWCLFF